MGIDVPFENSCALDRALARWRRYLPLRARYTNTVSGSIR